MLRSLLLLLLQLLLLQLLCSAAAATYDTGVIWVRSGSDSDCSSTCKTFGNSQGTGFAAVPASSSSRKAYVCGVESSTGQQSYIIPGTRYSSPWYSSGSAPGLATTATTTTKPSGCDSTSWAGCFRSRGCLYFDPELSRPSSTTLDYYCLCATTPLSDSIKWVSASHQCSSSGLQSMSPVRTCRGSSRAGGLRGAVGYYTCSNCGTAAGTQTGAASSIASQQQPAATAAAGAAGAAGTAKRYCQTGVSTRQGSTTSSLDQLCVASMLDGGGGTTGCSGQPASISNGAWSCNSQGTSCTGTCSQGYAGNPTPKATCQQGQWSVTGKCSRRGPHYAWLALPDGFSNAACVDSDTCVDAVCAASLGTSWHAFRVAPKNSPAGSLPPEPVCAVAATLVPEITEALDSWILGAATMTNSEQQLGSYAGLCYVSLVLSGDTVPSRLPPYSVDAAAQLLCSNCTSDCWSDFVSGTASTAGITCSLPAPPGAPDLPTAVMGTSCRFLLQQSGVGSQWYAGNAQAGTFAGNIGCLSNYDNSTQPWSTRTFDLLCPEMFA